MPNTPSLVQEGATVFSKGQNCSSHDSDVIKEILSAVGPTCFEVPEHLIDAVTGISGSGPAYMYIIIGNDTFFSKLLENSKAYQGFILTFLLQ